MIYRLSFTIFIFFLFMFVINTIKVQKNLINDYCWLCKILFIMTLFFISCLINNQFFEAFAFVSKYVSGVCLFIEVIVLHDFVLYFLYVEKTSKIKYVLWMIGLGCLLFGSFVFGYSFYYYYSICTQYKWIIWVLTILAVISLICNLLAKNLQ